MKEKKDIRVTFNGKAVKMFAWEGDAENFIVDEIEKAVKQYRDYLYASYDLERVEEVDGQFVVKEQIRWYI